MNRGIQVVFIIGALCLLLFVGLPLGLITGLGMLGSGLEASFEEELQEEQEARNAALQEWYDSLPQSQRDFCDVLVDHRARYNLATNDAQRAIIRKERGKSLKALGDQVNKWEGTVSRIESTPGGRLILAVTMPSRCDGFRLGTTVSDSSQRHWPSLIEADSELMEAAAKMEVGGRARFSGVLRDDPGGVDGFANLTNSEAGMMRNGYYEMRFTEIAAVK